MMQVFLYGPLLDDALRDIVCGSVKIAPLHLDTGRVVQVEGASHPTLLTEGAGCQGAFVTLDDRALARLKAYEKAFGYELAQFADVLTFLPAGAVAAGEAWELAAWQANHGDDGRRMARELMDVWDRDHGFPLAHSRGIAAGRAASRKRGETEIPPRSRPAAPAQDQLRCVSLTPSHARFFRLEVAELEVPRFDGDGVHHLSREVFVGTDAALILPYDPVTDRVALVEQFRMGPWRRGEQAPWVLEPIAGLVDSGESPATAARREADEEAGLTLSALHPMPSGYSSPGASSEFFFCYLGICELPEVTTWEGGLADENEDIRTHVMPRTRALEMVASGEIRVIPLAMMLCWLELNRNRLG